MQETTLPATDVVVVGLGAVGGTAVVPLTEAGLKVIGLEPGGWYSHLDFPDDEIRHDVRHFLSRAKVLNETPTWRPNAETDAGPGAIVIPMANGVGGTSIHYGMQFWRFLPFTFKEKSETETRYGARAIPTDSTLADWPISYDDLEPFYDKVEYLIGASGQAGNIKGVLDEKGNIFEGPRQRGYPNPPLRRTGWTEMISEAMKAKGYHPFPGPSSIRSEFYNGLPACTYCGFCNNTGCHIDAKGSTFLNGIPEAQATGNLQVVTYARVTEIMVDSDGKATGVRYIRDGQSYIQPASLIFLSTYVYENVRLLLLSKSDAFPNGLSNNHGQVGRHYMSHVYCGVNGLFPGKTLNVYTGTTGQFVGFDDLHGDNFDHTDVGFIGGATIAASHEVKPIGGAQSTPPEVPQWGSEWKAWLNKNAQSVGSIFAQCESLPYEDHFVDLDPVVKDPQGFPVARVTFDLKEQEQKRYDFMAEKIVELLIEAGASQTWTSFPKIPVAVNSHAYGGTRMGDDPETSVVDKWCLSHEVPNLAIVGGSCFPCTGGHNPTETAQALAWWAGDHIAQTWDSIV
jgi:gluconate 2-dehydrogenase alpha chain